MVNTRTEKRKNVSNDTKNEPPKKNLKKNELLAEYDTLQNKCKAFEDEKKIFIENEKKHLEAISLLEETINVLQTKLNRTRKDKFPSNLNTTRKDKWTSTTQTEDVYFMICEDCVNPAQDFCDLGAHIFHNHVS